MMAGMEDKEDNEDKITLEAMNGLSKILTQVTEKDIQPILINVALRIRPCFEKVNNWSVLYFGHTFGSTLPPRAAQVGQPSRNWSLTSFEGGEGRQRWRGDKRRLHEAGLLNSGRRDNPSLPYDL